MTHPAMNPDNVALVTGGANGIGLACAHRFAALGMRLVIVDIAADRLAPAAEALRKAGAPEVMTSDCDVADRAAVDALRAEATDRFGGVDALLNNAAVQPGSDILDEAGTWARVLEVNLGGIVNVAQSFVPGMIARGRPGLVINTGSKQGITAPPGDPAYNVAKAGVKVFTEALEHHLRNIAGGQVSARLLIPGFVFTGLTAGGRTEKPAGAWTPDQTADFLMDKLETDDFYILCPDNEVSRALDEKRMDWAMHDIIDNRPPLSRWHPDFAAAFSDFAKGV